MIPVNVQKEGNEVCVVCVTGRGVLEMELEGGGVGREGVGVREGGIGVVSDVVVGVEVEQLYGEDVEIFRMERALIYQAVPVNNLKIGVQVVVMIKLDKTGVVP